MDREFASKEDMKMIQGIAVMLMVFHHLFGFPDRVTVSYHTMFNLMGIHLENILAYFGRICVVIFSFCSGYGLYKKTLNSIQNNVWTIQKGYKNIFQSIEKFYLRYWIVVVFFLPYGFCKQIYKFEPLQFVKNILGIACTYNKEWWYVYTYIKLLISFPILFGVMFTMIKKGHRKLLFIISLSIISLTVFIECLKDTSQTGYLTYLISFYMGMVVGEFYLFEKMGDIISSLKILKGSIVFCMLAFAAGIRIFITSKIDFLIAPIIIFCLIYWLHSKWAISPFKYLLYIEGKNTQYIWLTHTFFAYYYFQKQLYSMSNSLLIYIECLIICTCIGIVLEFILQRLRNVVIRE